MKREITIFIVYVFYIYFHFYVFFKYSVSCPPKEKMMQPNGFSSQEKLIGIYDSRTAVDPSEWQDEQDDWEDNDV